MDSKLPKPKLLPITFTRPKDSRSNDQSRPIDALKPFFSSLNLVCENIPHLKYMHLRKGEMDKDAYEKKQFAHSALVSIPDGIKNPRCMNTIQALDEIDNYLTYLTCTELGNHARPID